MADTFFPQEMSPDLSPSEDLPLDDRPFGDTPGFFTPEIRESMYEEQRQKQRQKQRQRLREAAVRMADDEFTAALGPNIMEDPIAYLGWDPSIMRVRDSALPAYVYYPSMPGLGGMRYSPEVANNRPVLHHETRHRGALMLPELLEDLGISLTPPEGAPEDIYSPYASHRNREGLVEVGDQPYLDEPYVDGQTMRDTIDYPDAGREFAGAYEALVNAAMEYFRRTGVPLPPEPRREGIIGVLDLLSERN